MSNESTKTQMNRGRRGGNDVKHDRGRYFFEFSFCEEAAYF